MAGFFDRMKQSLGYQPPPEEPQNTSLLGQIQSNVSEATTLTTQQRFWGFGASVLITAICWGLSTISIMTARISGFVTMFTLGNIAAVAATCFLVGPGKQYRNMITKERLFSALAFAGSMLLTLFASFYYKKSVQVFFIVVPCMCVQMLALLWYCSTYIPGGQGLFLRLLGRANLDDVG